MGSQGKIGMSKLVYGDRIGKDGQLRPGASAIIYGESKEYVLLTRRSDNGRWCLPGGGMDPGESVAEACAREVLEETGTCRRSFRFIKGPVFCQLMMADEINRASPRTRSALLQAMQEHEVSIAGKRHSLPTPFHVMATQNPIEQEGTYPLPEAQLDRFLMEIDITYPDLQAERGMLIATTGIDEEKPVEMMTADDLMAAQRLLRRMPVGDSVIDAILALVRSGRPETSDFEEVRAHMAWGPSPRRSEEHTSELQSQAYLVCRLLLEKKKHHHIAIPSTTQPPAPLSTPP